MCMAQKKITRASKRRLMLFGTLSIGIIFYFIFSVSHYAINIYRLQKEEKQLKEDLVSLKSDEKNLKTEIEKLKDPEYLARYARENYLYSKDGEIVIKVQKQDTTNTPTSEKKDYSYIVFGGSIILLIIVGYVIQKNHKMKKKK